jgi:perosamine synthetase
MDELRAVAEGRGILVIEDAAHATGAAYHSQRVGSIGDATCFSFHAVKNLAMGEGGCITTDDPAINSTLRRLRWMGISKDTYSRSADSKSYSWYYEVSELGYKGHLSDIPASIGLVQLRRLEDLNGRRRQLLSRYNDALADTDWLETPVLRENVTSACHNYVIKTPFRNQLNIFLQEKGIATGVHYMPAHLHPYYKDLPADLPVTDRVWETLLTLPLFPDLTDDQVDYIVETIKSSRVNDWAQPATSSMSAS